MSNKLAQRLGSLTNVFILVSILSVIAFINKIDSHDYQADYSAVSALNYMKMNVNRNELTQATSLNRIVLQWMPENLPDYTDFMRTTQQEIEDRLSQLGVPIDEINCASGLNNCSNNDSLINVAPEDLPRRRNNSAMSALVDELEYIGQPLTIYIAIGVDTQSLSQMDLPPNCIFSGLSFPAFGSGTQPVATIEFSKCNNNAPGKNQTRSINLISSPLPDVHPLDLLDSNLSDTEMKDSVTSLITDDDERQHIRQAYGDLDLDFAKQNISDGINRAYKEINILGFTVSTRRYPFALVAFYLVALSWVLWILILAKQKSMRLFNSEEDIADAFLRFRLFRIFLWIVLPVLTIAAALPFSLDTYEVSLSPGEARILSFLVLLIVGLGIVAVRLADTLGGVEKPGSDILT